MKKKVLVVGAAMLAVAASASAAEARDSFGISINTGGGYYAPAPVYVAPQPVVYQPAPVVYQPAPVVYQPAPVYYGPYYSPSYRISYWNGPGWKGGRGHGHWRH